MFNLIAIIDQSRIIREGIVALLSNNDICQRVGSLENMDDWDMAFKGIEPDLVIINPGFWMKSDIKKFKTRYHISDKTTFVGIIYQYCDKEILNLFDETIYINDSEETILSKLRNLYRQNGEGTKSQNLTAREKDVLLLLLQGLSNKEVADRLIISTHTVIAHRKNIIEKTGIRSLSGLAVYALLNNIADMDQIAR